jgi:hypothetical protein
MTVLKSGDCLYWVETVWKLNYHCECQTSCPLDRFQQIELRWSGIAGGRKPRGA